MIDRIGSVPSYGGNETRVLIVTRTKDRPVLLRRAIASVIGQTYSDWFHIIVNDGGDPTAVEDLVRRNSIAYGGRCRVINHPVSYTMEAASNAAIASCRSEYIAIHDDDDAWDAQFLESCVKVLDDHSPDPTVGGVVTQATVVMETISSDGQISEQSRHLFSESSEVNFFNMLARNWFPPICFLFRRSALDAVGSFDSTLPVLGDWEFNIRLMRHFEVLTIPNELAFYHHRPDADGRYSNSVYKDGAVHKRQNARLIDRFLREDLNEGQISLTQAMLFSRMKSDIREMEERILSAIVKSRSDTIWEIKSHIEWLQKNT